MPVILVQANYCYKKMTIVFIVLFVTIVKMFNKHQRNYSTIEKECLSPILALQHNPLTFIHKMTNKNQRLLRWILMLQEHNLDVRHIKDKDNIISGALSRA